jgi:predicted nuclease of restriction endonuclease-like (RecB) superfamily
MSTDKHELKRNDSALFDRIVAILEQSRSNVVRAVNSNTVVAYWLIGQEIVKELQKGEERAEYGKRVIEDLSNRLAKRYGKGFSVPNLRNFRKFYVMFQDRKPEIRYPMGSELVSDRKRYPTGSELSVPGKGETKDGRSLIGFHPNLSWSHYRALMRVGKEKARDFYETEAVACGWNKRQLERQIHSLFYERLLMSKDKKGMLLEARTEENGGLKHVDVLKDPYVLEFLDLPDTAKMHESDLEQAIIDNLQHFLLELGKGFSFVARQKRMRFGDEDFYVDLVFYNFILKCFVLIDLKIGKLTHQDIGQMDGYVRMYEEYGKVEGDNPTIGLILCSEKNEAIARYSVLDDSKQLFASKYMLYLPTEEELQRELERERRLIEERQHIRDDGEQDSE